ncbi:Leucine-rich repeat-containing protein 9 [Orchesella cincta]|uniref:Leucine-rich repeat-containing protein 9 n=1 Tax=Orchesella cincta TaxID=48709 RepID=A0A1D2NBU9_ORCCI|nr:Leucine-rich repeat-containing protein 9 [Orchesella cincta]
MTDFTRGKDTDRNRKGRQNYFSSESSDVSDTEDKSGDGDKSSRKSSDFRLEFQSKRRNEKSPGRTVLLSTKSESKDRVLHMQEKDRNNNLETSISNSSLTGDDAPCGSGRSIEIFFGDFTNFGNFYQALSYTDENNSSNNAKQEPPISDKDSQGAMKNVKNSVNPFLVKKLCLVGHPLESFRGINNFKRLLEAWVTNCTIRELRTRDLEGLQFLQRLYAFGCSLEKVDPLRLDNLRILWLSGNRLTSLSFLNHGLPCLQELNFKMRANASCQRMPMRELSIVDPMYGKCPVACLCDSRPIIISSIKNISVLNGKKITADEINITKEYIRQRCMYYYCNSVAAKSSHVALRNATIVSVYKQLENIGDRIMELLTFMAQTEYQISTIQAFSKSKALVKDEMQKVHRRIADLRMWAVVTIERFETVIHINRWEQEVEEWIKWIEYQSYGSIQAYVAHSVLDLASSKDVENIRATIHQLISGLSCSKP